MILINRVLYLVNVLIVNGGEFSLVKFSLSAFFWLDNFLFGHDFFFNFRLRQLLLSGFGIRLRLTAAASGRESEGNGDKCDQDISKLHGATPFDINQLQRFLYNPKKPAITYPPDSKSGGTLTDTMQRAISTPKQQPGAIAESVRTRVVSVLPRGGPFSRNFPRCLGQFVPFSGLICLF